MPPPQSEIIWLDREVVGPAIKTMLNASETNNNEMSKLRDIADEDWDLFLRVLADGSLLLSAVAVSVPCAYELCISNQIPEY